MTVTCDLHTHTTYCDGHNSPRAMVLSALDKGLTTLGFSGHSHTAFDESYCMTTAGTLEYIGEINALKREFDGRISILCGIEKDFFSDYPTDAFDYVIGSVHYIKIPESEIYVPVDESADILKEAAERWFSGDLIALAELYFTTEAKVAKKTNCDIIGHFDLISKFNENDRLFDSHDARYVSAWQAACDELLESGKPFEINTGAISRGYRTSPYPSADMIDYIKKRGGRLILSSDSHSADTIGFEFEKYAHLI